MRDNRHCKKEGDNMEPIKAGFIEDINLGDLELLSDLNVRLIDINRKNVVFNGKLYLIDPGIII